MPYKGKYNRRERDLCSQCPKPLKKPYKRCEKCLEVDRRTSRIRQAKVRLQRQEDGLCVKCGSPLNEDADKGKINCINCRENTKWNHLINK